MASDVGQQALTLSYRNKWVLNSTEVPLFFLCTQLIIAVVFFLAAHALGLLHVPLEFDPVVLKGLVPMIGLNVIGLRYVPMHPAIPRNIIRRNSNNGIFLAALATEGSSRGGMCSDSKSALASNWLILCCSSASHILATAAFLVLECR